MIRSRGQRDVRFGMFVLCISTACAQLQAHIPNQRQSKMNVTTPIEKLETYVLRPGAFDDLNIPRDLDRGSVAEFVRNRISPPISLKSLKRLENVVSFLRLQEVCGHLQALLFQSCRQLWDRRVRCDRADDSRQLPCSRAAANGVLRRDPLSRAQKRPPK